MSQLYRQAHYTISATQLSELPPDTGIEVAFAGRSNAGKSSAINTITDQKALARISKTPGRTQMINFFALDDDRALVDLPGYGYAKVPEKMKIRCFQRRRFSVRNCPPIFIRINARAISEISRSSFSASAATSFGRLKKSANEGPINNPASR